MEELVQLMNEYRSPESKEKGIVMFLLIFSFIGYFMALSYITAIPQF